MVAMKTNTIEVESAVHTKLSHRARYCVQAQKCVLLANPNKQLQVV